MTTSVTTGVLAVAPFLFALLVILIPVVFVLIIVRMVLNRRDQQRLTREEAAQLQNLHEAFQRMEERISNLETILMHGQRPADRENRY